MYWTIDLEGKIWFHDYEYDVEKYIRISRVKVCKWGQVEPFGLNPNLKYWLTDVSPSYSTDRECMCHEDMNSVYHYVKKRLDIDQQREILRVKIDSGEFNEFIQECVY